MPDQYILMYFRFSMVSMCPISKRIWVGAKNGGLAFYDLKQHSKCQVSPQFALFEPHNYV